MNLMKGCACAVLAILCFVGTFMTATVYASAEESDRDGNAVVVRFDSVQAIARAVSSTYGLCTGFLDRSMECRFFCSPGIVTITLDASDRFDAGAYPYMKIKYFANTMTKNSTVYYATEENPDMDGGRAFSFSRGTREKWHEDVLNITERCTNWNGTVSAFRIDVNQSYNKKMDEYVFIEYIAFFQTREEAESFGGLTEEQKAGTDLISLYAKGYRTSRIDAIGYAGVQTAETDARTETGRPAETEAVASPPRSGASISKGTAIGILAGAVVIGAVLAAVVIGTNKSKQRKGSE